jgi:hypothetical protein
LITENHTQLEGRFAPIQRAHRNCACTESLPTELRRIRLNSLHPGGKDFFLLRSKYPVCETIGWIPVL